MFILKQTKHIFNLDANVYYFVCYLLLRNYYGRMIQNLFLLDLNVLQLTIDLKSLQTIICKMFLFQKQTTYIVFDVNAYVNTRLSFITTFGYENIEFIDVINQR